MTQAIDDTLVFFSIAGHLPDEKIQSACREWLRQHPECPVVVAPSGRAVAVRARLNRFTRERWESHVAASPELKVMATCPELAGIRLEPLPEEVAAAAAKRQTFIGKIASFLSAVTGPRASDDVVEQRLAICSSNTCGKLKRDGDKLYCGACGCGQWRLAELSNKLRFARLECPVGAWKKIDTEGDSNG